MVNLARLANCEFWVINSIGFVQALKQKSLSLTIYKCNKNKMQKKTTPAKIEMNPIKND